MLWEMSAYDPDETREGREYALTCVDESMIAMGWDEIGDLTSFSNRDEVKKEVTKYWPDYSERKINSTAGSLWRFAIELGEKDIVICPDRDASRYYFGVVTSTYHFTPSPNDQCPFRHRRDMDWFLSVPKDELERICGSLNFGGYQAISRVTKNSDSILQYVNQQRPGSEPVVPPSRPQRADRLWGRLAELRALEWLKGQGHKPRDVSTMSRGWDIECEGLKYEVKGRKSYDTQIGLTQNEMSKAKRYRGTYVLLVFTAATRRELISDAIPVEYEDPANSLQWRSETRYLLRERRAHE